MTLRPEYIAARVALAGLLNKTGDTEGALNQLRQAAASNPRNSEVFEQIGDIEAARGRGAEARAAYQSASGVAPDTATRKRIDKKLKALK